MQNDTGFTQKQKKELKKELKQELQKELQIFRAELMTIIEPMQETLQRVTRKLAEHDQRFERIEAILETLPTRNEWQIMYDNIMGLYHHNESEMAAMDSRLYRCEEKLGIT